VTDSYQEKFPSGLVEHSTHWRFEARWHPRAGFYLALGAEHARYRDYENQAGVKKNYTRFTLNLWWEKMWLLGLD
jgi:hypothetical protein